MEYRYYVQEATIFNQKINETGATVISVHVGYHATYMLVNIADNSENDPKRLSDKEIIAIILSVTIIPTLVIICAIILAVVFLRKRRMRLTKLRGDELSLKLLQNTSEKPSFEIDKSLFEIPFESLKNVEELSTGGSGATVYKAVLNSDVVVIKLFKVTMFSGERDFEKFQHELRLLAYAIQFCLN